MPLVFFDSHSDVNVLIEKWCISMTHKSVSCGPAEVMIQATKLIIKIDKKMTIFTKFAMCYISIRAKFSTTNERVTTTIFEEHFEKDWTSFLCCTFETLPLMTHEFCLSLLAQFLRHTLRAVCWFLWGQRIFTLVKRFAEAILLGVKPLSMIWKVILYHKKSIFLCLSIEWKVHFSILAEKALFSCKHSIINFNFYASCKLLSTVYELGKLLHKC